MRKVAYILSLIFTLNSGEAKELKKFNEDMISNIQKDTQLDEEKYRGRAPASSSEIEEVILENAEKDNNVDASEQTVQRKNLFIPDRW